MMTEHNGEWIPDVGKLVVRQELHRMQNNLILQFRDELEDDWHYRSIAELRDFTSGPHFGGSIECMKDESGLSGAGMMIVRRYATDSDLRAVIRLWRSKSSIEDWLEVLEDLPILLPEERDRIISFTG